jgi:dTMP kinase
MGGKLIIFEGVEGCGKTTQIQLTCDWLLGSSKSISPQVMITRQPGGTQLGVHLRQLLLRGAGEKPIADRAELLLYAADRAQHVQEVLQPNLALGKIILCDRYTDSTVAYQGYGRGLSLNLIQKLNFIATGGLESDLTLWLDVDVAVGLARTRKREEGSDRIEQETIAFHQRVQQGYAELAQKNPQRVVRIDASLSAAAVQEQIQSILASRLQEWRLRQGAGGTS